MTDPCEPAEEWDGVERRLSDPALEELRKTDTAILASANATDRLADALINSVLKQGRSMRNWMVVLSIASMVSLCIGGWSAVQVTQTNNRGQVNPERIVNIASCVEPGSECFNRVAEYNKAITDADRQLLALEIICYVTGECPPGMTPENIPDLEPLGGTTSTTTGE